MPRPRKLQRFAAEAAGTDFALTIEDEAGETIRLVATEDQIEEIADMLDDLLSGDADSDHVNGASEDEE